MEVSLCIGACLCAFVILVDLSGFYSFVFQFELFQYIKKMRNVALATRLNISVFIYFISVKLFI